LNDREPEMDDSQPEPPYLETDRLILRRFTLEDAHLIVELDADPEVRRYTQLNPTTRQEASDEILPAWLRYYQRYPGYGFWAAIERQGGEFIGWFHLRPGLIDGRDDEPELGYRLRRAFWGRGYATEASIALIAKAFDELGARTVWAETMTINTASRRVMEKAGLRFVELVHREWPEKLPGDEHGDVRYEISRDEWKRHERRARATSA
jgi:RimJ/RimL family protein N-acetyltransferase